jgi:eukaryotic-like serine/threonine-protein kinase
MGVVYKARDPKIDRLVAIKTISFQGVGEEKSRRYRDRFVIEAKAAGRLSHPGIVAVFDVGEEPETHTPYIVMEYVQGDTLERLLALSPGGLKTERALGIVKQVAEALAYAHKKGVVHRDIKPANIIVAADGRAKIADFGVAKLESEQNKGMMFGTPAYMSPEQVSGAALDGRSDLFSLGVVLYSALVGFRPFHGSGASTISFKVLNSDPVPASSFNPTLMEEVDHVIFRAMAKDIKARYQSGAEMALDLADLLAGKRPRTSGPAEVKSQNFTFLEAIAPACESGIMRLRPPEIAEGTQRRPHSEVPKRRSRRRQTILIGCAAVEVVLALVLGYQLFGRANAQSNITPNAIDKRSSTAAPELLQTPELTPLVKEAQAVRIPNSEKHTAASTGPGAIAADICKVNLEIEHQFKTGQLTMWVDDVLLTQEPLFGESRKKLGLFGGHRGQQSSELLVNAGTHVVRVEVDSPEARFERAAEIDAEFRPGTIKVFRVTARRSPSESLDLRAYDPLPVTGEHPK